ncbi:MFS transporter [Microlunatus ginsengisoli]|uniref:MFS transporter n=1 Tax=Microlunatus ginsengisoli TaxID=363863 RepID=A0ABP7A5J1_9ACTN
MNTTVLRANADFRRLWIGQAASKLGSRGSVVSVPLLVLSVTHSPALMATVALFESISELVVMLPAGVLADRFDRRRLMIVADLGCFLAVATLAVAAALGFASLPLILAVTVIDCAFGSLFAGSSAAALRRLVRADDLGAAIAVVQARNSAVYLIGPLLGGATFGIAPWLPFAFDALTFAVSAVLLLQIRTSLAVIEPPGPNLINEATAGLRFVLGKPFLRYVVIVAAAINSIFGGVIVAAIAVSDAERASSTTIGAIVTSAGVGAMLGSLAMPWLRRRFSSGQLVLGTLSAMVLLIPLMGVVEHPLAMGALIVGCSVLAPVMSAVILTELTAITPDELQGRVQSAMSFAALCATPVGPMIAGAALGAWGPLATFVALDAVLVGALVFSVSGLRNLRQLHAEAAAPGPADAAVSPAAAR